MEPFTTLTGVAVPLLHDNIDTDTIIPSREMRTVSKSGLANGLFSGWRYRAIGTREPNPDFILNDPSYADARILLTGENFGCGSSREHAVWALAEYGFRAIVAPSFNPIFRGNCVANGVLPLTLSAQTIEELVADLGERERTLTIDLVDQRISSARLDLPFEIDQALRQALLEGADPIDQTLKFRDKINGFVDDDRKRRPWAYPDIRSQ